MRRAGVLVALAAGRVAATASYRPRHRGGDIDVDQPRSGIVCTTDGNAAPTSTDLRPDHQDRLHQPPRRQHGLHVGLLRAATPFQHPGPVLCVNEGDTVTVILHNTPAPSRRRRRSSSPARRTCSPTARRSSRSLDGTATLTSLTDTAGRRRHRHLQLRRRPARHVPLRVGHRPRDAGPDGPVRGADRAADDGPTRLQPATYRLGARPAQFDSTTEEFMVLLSEIDPYQHQAVETCTDSGLTRRST